MIAGISDVQTAVWAKRNVPGTGQLGLYSWTSIAAETHDPCSGDSRDEAVPPNSTHDVVLLATPPAFRPLHTEAAVQAGKHLFIEKPIAVDAPGVRSVMASCRRAKKKGINVKDVGADKIKELAIGAIDKYPKFMEKAKIAVDAREEAAKDLEIEVG